MNRPRDWKARESALDPKRSFIVQAPAGSGKTELLIQRMLVLLAGVSQPEEVLAITFTRKAAAEMASRLFTELQLADDIDATAPEDPHKQLSRDLARQVLSRNAELDWNLLQQPGRIRVKTIDSLCSDLARQLPLDSGLGQDFVIEPGPESGYLEAVANTLSVMEDENDPLRTDVMRMLDRYDNQFDRLSDLLVSMLGCRDQWLPHLLSLHQDGSFDRVALEEALEILLGASLEQLLELMPDSLLRALPRFFDYALGHDPSDAGELRALMSSGCHGGKLAPGTDRHALPHWKTLARRLITKDGKNWRKSVNAADGFPAPSSASGDDAVLFKTMKQDFLNLLAACRDNDILRENLHAMMSLPDPVYVDDDWASLEALLRILLRTVTEWQLVSAQSGKVDFIEVASRASAALGSELSPSNLALRLDHQIQHVLIDEFQDTSSGQIHLLERLTGGWAEGDGRTIFLVGDPMQSIYRFRKAEVSLFIRTWDGELLSHVNPETLSLSVNFRSSKPIVEWVNQAFPAVMPRQSDAVMGAVRYSPATTRPVADPEGSVSVRLTLGTDDLHEAEHIADIIGQAGTDESIAILVRSRGHARATLNLLNQIKDQDHRYRYRAIDFFRLNESPVIQDLMSLTLAVVQPADRLAWLALLRAPFCGLSLPELECLTRRDSGRLIVQQLVDASGDQSLEQEDSADFARRLRRVTPVLTDALSRYQRQPLRDIVEAAWLRLGGPATTRHADEMRDAQTFFELLSSLQLEQARIDREVLDDRLEQLYATADTSPGARISVMTIYAAKGLEFDRVIIPGLNRSTSGDKGKLVQWFELAGTEHIVMSPMRNEEDKRKSHGEGDLVRFIEKIEKNRQSLELGRLFYVASTRARKHLHLLGSLSPRKDGSVSPRSNSMLGVFWPAVAEHSIPRPRQAEDEAVHPQESQAVPGIPQVHRRLPADWSLPEPPADLPRPDLPTDTQKPSVEFSWAGEEARLGGSLAHRIFQWIVQSGVGARGFSSHQPYIQSWCRTMLQRRGIADRKAQTVIENVLNVIFRCIDSPTGKWILAEHDQSESELAITAVIDGRPRNLVVDRTFMDKGERWVIDFKTSSHAGGDLEGFILQETSRYEQQLSTYRKAFAGAGDEPVRTALYYPVFDRLVEID